MSTAVQAPGQAGPSAPSPGSSRPRQRFARRRGVNEGVLAAPAAIWLLFFFVAPVLLVLW